MISPSVLRIGQKVKIDNLEWTVFQLNSEYVLLRHSGFSNVAINYSDIDPSAIMPTEEDKSIQELVNASKHAISRMSMWSCDRQMRLEKAIESLNNARL